jgi:hypothetical protein
MSVKLRAMAVSPYPRLETLDPHTQGLRPFGRLRASSGLYSYRRFAVQVDVRDFFPTRFQSWVHLFRDCCALRFLSWAHLFRNCGTISLTLIAVLLASQKCSAAECIPFAEAEKHIGEAQCVRAKVVRVEEGPGGVHYFDFCEDYRLCSFSVVVFSYDLKKVGEVRQLAGKTIEIRGEVKEYDGRAEIILENPKQLSGEAAGIPSLPKGFDVEQGGHFSAGRFRPSQGRGKRRKRQTPTLPVQIPEDVESQ